MPSIKDFVAGARVVAHDRMQRQYTYTTTYKAGTNIKNSGISSVRYDDFEPYYTPRQMLVMGVFEGKYLNDCTGELPAEWYCRYWLGRRIPAVDKIQIARRRAFARHYAQVKKHASGRLDKRPRQRQALLQWSWQCDI